MGGEYIQDWEEVSQATNGRFLYIIVRGYGKIVCLV